MKPAREKRDNSSTELNRLFGEALRCLESTDLPGANAALERVLAEASFPRNAAELTGYVVAAPGAHETGNESEDRGRKHGLFPEKSVAGRGAGPLAQVQGEAAEKLK